MEHIGNKLRQSIGSIANWSLFEVLMMLAISHQHPPDVTRQRTAMILARVHLISLAFALLIILWIVVDVLTFDKEVWLPIALYRIAASTGFGALAIYTRGTRNIIHARIAIALMFAIPMVFYAVAMPLLSNISVTGWSKAVCTGYAMLPFIIVGGLGLLPITLLEGLAFAAPLLTVYYVVQIFLVNTVDIYSLLGVGWLLVLLSTASSITGMSQLQLIIELARQASTDPLTKIFVRRVGQELLEAQFNGAERQKKPFVVAFADIDNFKSVNDDYGHDVGDRILRQCADTIRDTLRKSDLMVRWGGEEFLLIMPDTDHEGASHLIGRLYEQGLGLRPDGSKLTISMGVAERQVDNSKDWEELVALADARMYEAKKAGKNRFISSGTPNV